MKTNQDGKLDTNAEMKQLSRLWIEMREIGRLDTSVERKQPDWRRTWIRLAHRTLRANKKQFYAMVVCRLHDTAGSLAHGGFISRPTGNPDPLIKSRPTGKIQTHWLGHKVVHIVKRNIQKLKSCFHQYFI